MDPARLSSFCASYDHGWGSIQGKRETCAGSPARIAAILWCPLSALCAYVIMKLSLCAVPVVLYYCWEMGALEYIRRVARRVLRTTVVDAFRGCR